MEAVTFDVKQEKTTKRKVDKINTLTEDEDKEKCNDTKKVINDHDEVKHSKKGKIENTEEPSTLSEKISMYEENGPFLTQLPQFVEAADYLIRGYKTKLKVLG